MKKLLVALVVGAVLLTSAVGWCVDTDRYARIVRHWTSLFTSGCCSTCDTSVPFRSMLNAYLSEVDSHSEWSEAYYYDQASYAKHFYESSEVTGGEDHVDKGLDNTDAVMIGLHGNIGSHNGKDTYRARVKEKLGSEDPTDFCKAWVDFYDFGDDNGDLDLEWLHIVSCHGADAALIGGDPDDYHKWFNAFDGLNAMTSYAGESWYYTQLGEDLAEDFFDNVEDSWTINNYTTSTAECGKDDCSESSGHKRCPIWLTYHETVAQAQSLMAADDYTTRASEPPGHGGNNYHLVSYYPSCDPCCEVD